MRAVCVGFSAGATAAGVGGNVPVHGECCMFHGGELCCRYYDKFSKKSEQEQKTESTNNSNKNIPH